MRADDPPVGRVVDPTTVTTDDRPADETIAGATAADAATTDDGDDGRKKKRKGVAGFLRELPVLILVAFLLAFLLRTFVVQVFYIPSSSMVPTLEVNDRILVEKVTYRFREPRRGEIVVFEGETRAQPVQRGGVVQRALRGLGQLLGLSPADARDFVKRVIGLPGDVIRIDESGTVFVNEVALAEPYLNGPDERPYGPVTVPEGKLFFLGDNRTNSSDSRFGLGFVDRSRVVGRAIVIIWPFDHLTYIRGPHYAPIPVALDAARPDRPSLRLRPGLAVA